MPDQPKQPPPAPATVLDALPLFPLQRVLFPGGVLPLQIFEVRYLDMIGRAAREGTPFGLVCLSQGSEVQRPAGNHGAYADESFHDIGTLAVITDISRPQPGLIFIRCEGTQRFALRARTRLANGLWTGAATLLEPDLHVPVPDDLAATGDALRAVVAELQARAEPGHSLPFAQPYRWDDCAWLAHRWCELLPLPAALQQRLLETASPLLRLELVADMLDRTTRRAPGR